MNLLTYFLRKPSESRNESLSGTQAKAPSSSSPNRPARRWAAVASHVGATGRLACDFDPVDTRAPSHPRIPCTCASAQLPRAQIHRLSMGTRVLSIVEALYQWSGETDVEANEEMQSPNGDARFLSSSAVHKSLSAWVADDINEVQCSCSLTLASVTVALESVHEDQLKNGKLRVASGRRAHCDPLRARPHRRFSRRSAWLTCVFASRPLASVRR